MVAKTCHRCKLKKQCKQKAQWKLPVKNKRNELNLKIKNEAMQAKSHNGSGSK